MRAQTLRAGSTGPNGRKAFEDALNYRKAGPFFRWHLLTKFQVMESLFQKYIGDDSKFLDMACGTGDGLFLASLCGQNASCGGWISTPQICKSLNLESPALRSCRAIC